MSFICHRFDLMLIQNLPFIMNNAMLRPRSLYDAKYGTLSPSSMDRLYSLGAAASIEAVESEQSSNSHSLYQ